jgi:uncharacterized membrane protein YbhN (UPF0104 family)
MQGKSINWANRWATILGYLIVVATLALFCRYIYAHKQEFGFLADVSYPEVAVAALFVLISYGLNTYQLHLFLSQFGVNLPSLEVFALTISMILGNLLIPMRGGSGALAVYLRSVHNLDFQAFAAIYGGTAVLITLINSGMALGVLIYLYAAQDFMNGPLTAVTAGFFMLCLYLSLFPPPIKWKSRGVLAFAFNAANSWHILAKNRSLLLKLSISLIETTLALMFAFYFSYKSIGAPISFSGVLVVSSLGTVANLIPLTPGSFGFFEAVTVNVPQLFSIDAARSVTAAGIFRILTLFWAFSIGIPAILYLLRIRKKAGNGTKA